jgi:hypothetical protein
LQSGNVIPVITTAVVNTSVDQAAATSDHFDVSGVVSQTVPGAVLAGIEASPLGGFTDLALNASQTYGSVDGNSTGTYAYSKAFADTTISAGQVTGASYNGGVSQTTINGNFSAAAAGDYVAAQAGAGGPLDPNFPAAPVKIVSVNGTSSITIDKNIPLTDSQGSITMGWSADVTFTDTGFSSGSGGAFTTAGTAGGKAGIGLISSTSFTMTSTFSAWSLIGGAFPLGGASGHGAANCLLTGWDATSHPGPAQLGLTTPATAPGTTTALVAASGGLITQTGTTQAITPPNSAYVNLNPNPPNALGASYNMGVGAQITVTLPTSVGSVGYPVTSCSLVGSQPYGSRVTVTANAGVCNYTISDSGLPSTPAQVTFDYTATALGPPSETSTAGTITLHIGTPPVDQMVGQNVNPGQLILSCNAPDAGTVSNPWPETSCAPINMTDITLNGLAQTTSHAANPIYVSDDRGDPSSGWSLSAYMVATPSNTNSACSAVKAFCDQSAGSGTGNAVIPASDLALSTPVCADYTGTTNPVTSAVSGNLGSPLGLCSAAAGTSGGTFSMNTNFTLTIPPTVFAGQYYGTVEYLVIAT